ncbi:hypothetical protein FRC00_014125 [Tulasnella sp. 408]|nr:hypothetical protein FRC00_014125 [Tulasnella sp. 408]
MDHPPELLHDNPPRDNKSTNRRPPHMQHPGNRRAAVVMSPTFHIDPNRSSSSDNGSLATPFPFPSAGYPLQEGPRDSMTTHHSSYYPHSTSSYSNTSPPSPSSPSASSFAASIQTGTDADATSLDPHHPQNVLFDPDDVSYRLKLLVKNNYFLPPAHSKPSQSELAAAAEQAAQAQASPNTANKPFFRDIFRVGKVKSSATGTGTSRPMQTATQQQAQQTARSVRHANAPVPPLRPAKSANALVRPSHTRNPTNLSSSTTSRTLSVTAAGGGPVERRGRVVVIRETVEDIQIAAKEAEIQMRVQQQAMKEDAKDGAKGAKTGSSRKSARDGEDSEDEDEEELIVDPTDAVDLPSYSFQPMASGLVGLGLGVDASGLSAGVLADQLPPPSSPTFGMTKEDMLWRKALLHQAVGLSMMSIPAPSSSSSSPSMTPQTTRTRKKSTTKDSIASSTPQVNSSAPPSSLGRSSGAKVNKQQPLPKSLGSKSPLPNVQQPIMEDLASAVAASRPNTSGTAKVRKLTLPTGKLNEQEEGKELPLGGGGEGAISPGGRGRTAHPPRTHSPLFPTLDDNRETIRKTLTRPLLSEGYESEHTTRSSDYFTPFSPSFVVSSPSGNRRELGEGMKESRTFDTITSGSYYSEEGDEREQDDELHDLRTSMARTERSSYQNPMSPTSQTHDSRQSNESGSRTRPSGESTTGSSAQPRASLAESHVSMFSTSFGPISGRQTPARPSRSPSRQMSIGPGLRPGSAGKSEDGLIQPPPPELMVHGASSTESGVPPHEVAATSSPAPAPPRPQRSSTTPGPSALAWRRSQHLRPLDLLSVSALGPSQGGIRSAPPVETNEGSFLDFDAPHSATPFKRSSWVDEESDGIYRGTEEDLTVVYVDNTRMRSRLPSNAATIVPSPMKGMFAAPSASGSQQDHDAPSRPLAMHFPNTSNPYLQKPFAEVDPSMPLTNTPPVTQPTFLSSLTSGFGLLSHKKSKDTLNGSGSLLQYARDPKARSTPTLSPSAKLFAEVPGRHSNVSGNRGRFGHGIIEEAELDPSMPRTSRDDPDIAKLDGLMAQHIQAERDLFKKVARGAARTDRE